MPILPPLSAEAGAKNTMAQILIPSLSSARNRVVDADRSHLDGDEVLQGNVLFYQELLSFGD